MMELRALESHRSFGGIQKRIQHFSRSLNCEMFFSIYLPPQYETEKLPILYWLSGITSNDQNFTTKAGAQKYAAKLGMILIMPDTSPRGEHVADVPDFDLGQGASFYVNAVRDPWKQNYQMFDYVSQELPELITTQFRTNGKQAIAGHSMGGHGALMLALRHPGKFTSASAFAPAVNPMAIPFGRKAFKHYLGTDQTLWQQYDSSFLMDHYKEVPFPILIDQGTQDELLNEQLQPKVLEAIAIKKNWPFTLRWQQGYDHSYYFVASFIKDHLLFHAKYLR